MKLPSWVIKVPKYTKEKDYFLPALKNKKEYDEIFQLLGHIPGLIVPEHTLVINGFRNRKPTSAVIQAFLGSNFRDLFTEVPSEELAHLLRDNPSFLDTTKQLVAAFSSHPQLYEKQLDIPGNRNLSVITSPQGSKLLLLDPHYRGSAYREKEKEELIRQRISYLEATLSRSQRSYMRGPMLVKTP